MPAFVEAESFSDPFTGEGDGPSLEELEAQMGGEIAQRDAAAGSVRSSRPAASPREEEEENSASSSALPDLDDLVARLPGEVRETLDELFRARFVKVRKLPKKVFESATTKSGADGRGGEASS